MDILLLLPCDGTYRYGGPFRRSLSYAPLSLATLAALVPAELGARIEIVDEGIEPPRARRDRYDVVGMSIVASSAPRAYALAAEWRSRGALVVMGGAHATLAPHEAIRHADVVVVGPAEEEWPALLRDVAAGGRPAGIRRGIAQPLRAVRRDLFPHRRYLSVPTVMATRGCARPCRFCAISAMSGGRAFSRPVGEVVEEVRSLGARRVLFLDPNVVPDRAYALALFEGLTPLRIRWAGSSTVQLPLDDELMEAALRSGLEGLLVGFETVIASSLDAERKAFARPEQYLEAVRRLHAGGASVLGTFMLGLDGEGPEDFSAMLDFVDEAGIDIPRFGVVTPFPGTELHEKLDRQGRILTRDLSRYDSQHVVFRPNPLSPAALQSALHAAWRRAYSLPRIARRVARARSGKLILAAASLGFRHVSRRQASEAPGPEGPGPETA
jgi:radical SAM superfamily enzyme YgiQ (UPF0313 family)